VGSTKKSGSNTAGQTFAAAAVARRAKATGSWRSLKAASAATASAAGQKSYR
jgi:hypothetical protein